MPAGTEKTEDSENSERTLATFARVFLIVFAPSLLSDERICLLGFVPELKVTLDLLSVAGQCVH